MHTRLSWRAILTLLFAAWLAPAVGAGEKEKRVQDLGFWEIGVSDFDVETPLVISLPGSDKFYTVLPFTLRNEVSLHRVLDHMKAMLAKTPEEEQALRALYQRSIERLSLSLKDGPVMTQLQVLERQLKQVKSAGSAEEAYLKAVSRTLSFVQQEMALKATGVKLSARVITDTGKTYHDLSNTVVRDLATKLLRRRKAFPGLLKKDSIFRTTLELAQAPSKRGEQLFGLAIFPQIDPLADSFEVRLSGLGRRIMPSYYPGHLLKLGPRPDAKLKKVLRLFYERPGDERDRPKDEIRFVSRRSEWLWLWANEFYPMQPESFTLKRSVDQETGKPLAYEYRYFSYELFNSTPDPKQVRVLKAGLAPKVRWHGVDLVVKMLEKTGEQPFRLRQAVRAIAKAEGDEFPAEEVRVVNTTVAPGKLAKGVAVVEWGVSNAEELLKSVTAHLGVAALTS
ncbi:MAG: hypothetical protein ACYTGH_21610, partial [Planctomycetota bacterium]